MAIAQQGQTQKQQPAPKTPQNLTFSQLENLWDSSGGNKQWAPTMAAVAEAESSGNPNAQNPSGATGLWQTLMSAQGQPFQQQHAGQNLDNPQTAAQIAIQQLGNGSGISNWDADPIGAYVSANGDQPLTQQQALQMSTPGQPAAPTGAAAQYATQQLAGGTGNFGPNSINTSTYGSLFGGQTQPILSAANAQLGNLGLQQSLGQSEVGLSEQQAQQNAALALLGQQFSGQQTSIQQGLLSGQQKLSTQQQALEQSQYGLGQAQQQESIASAGQQQSAEQQQYGLSLAGLQQQYGLNPVLQGVEESQFGLGQQSAQQGIANQAQQQAAEEAGYGLQYDPNNPNSQYSLSQAQLAQQALSESQQHALNLPQLASNAYVSGSGNSQGQQAASTAEAQQHQAALTQEQIAGGQLGNQLTQAQTSQAAEEAGYTTQQQQAQEALASSQAGQTGEEASYANQQLQGAQQIQSAEIGNTAEQQAYATQQQQAAQSLKASQLAQTGEKQQYQYGQKQLGAQQQSLALVQKQTGLSEAQIRTQVAQQIAQAGLGGQINVAGLSGQKLAEVYQAVSQAIQTQSQGSLVNAVSGKSKPKGK